MRHLIGCSLLAVFLPAAAVAQTGSITGTVTRADTSARLSGVQVFVTEGSGYFSAFTNGAGVFSIANLAPGSYKAFTSVGGLFINELFDNVACVGVAVSRRCRRSARRLRSPAAPPVPASTSPSPTAAGSAAPSSTPTAVSP